LPVRCGRRNEVSYIHEENAESAEEMKLKELKSSRLAMTAVVGLAAKLFVP